MTGAVLDAVFRADYGRILATLIRWSRSFEDAEEVLQDAFASAAAHWSGEGLPDNPSAWILQAAKHRLVDRRRVEGRRRELWRQHGPRDLIVDSQDDAQRPDDSLRLIFTCCHPALAPEAQIAITLRTLGGLETSQIARAFLVPEATMAQRLVRVKHKIAEAGIPFQIPDPSELAERTTSVLHVLYLIFNEGYAASEGDSLLRMDLCAEALRLAGLVNRWLPGVAEGEGLEALMMLIHSRRDARVDAEGKLVTLDLQDRSLWKQDEIGGGVLLIEKALSRKRLGPYQLQAAIAAVHCEASGAVRTDWRQIASLYGELGRMDPSSVVFLNHAVAIGHACGWPSGLAHLERIEGLERYAPFHAGRAQMLKRVGRHADALAAFARAISLTANQVERDYLNRQMHSL